MNTRHLTEYEFLHILSSGPHDPELAALEQHLAQCTECTTQLMREAALEICCLDAAQAPLNRPVRVARSLRQHSVIAAGAALMAVAGVVLTSRFRSNEAGSERIVAETNWKGSSQVLPAEAIDDAWALRSAYSGHYATFVELGPFGASGKARILRSTLPNSAATDEFASLAQAFPARRFAGKRIRFSATLRTSEVTGSATLSMQIDRNSETLVSDDGALQAVRGTTDWQQVTVVLDVAMDADTIRVGSLLEGTGALWMTNPTVEVVGAEVSPTNRTPVGVGADFVP
jgi:hypothetical protein